MAVLGDGPLGGDAAVVEDRFAGELDLDLALQAEGDAHEQVLGVFVGGRSGVGRDGVHAAAGPERERVAHGDPAGGGRPGREQRVGARLVHARGRHVDAERPEPKRPGLAIEQRAEHRGSVEAGHAQPVDRPVGRHERAGVTVREERVVGDRRERRGGGGALGCGVALGCSVAHMKITRVVVCGSVIWDRPRVCVRGTGASARRASVPGVAAVWGRRGAGGHTQRV